MVLLVLLAFLVVGVVAGFCKSFASAGLTGFGLGFLISVADLNWVAGTTDYFWTTPFVMGIWATMAYGFSLDSKNK